MSNQNSYQIFNQNYNSKFLLLCDHASNKIPKSISKNALGLNKEKLNSHIAFDIGAKKTAMLLSEKLKCPLMYTNYSRLVIDPNRAKEDPTSIMQIYDGTIILGNADLSNEQIQERRKNFYEPYHKKIAEFLKFKKISGCFVCIVSIHSFTPRLKGKSQRPWDVGILWDRDERISKPLIREFTKLGKFCIGENQPYSGNLKGDTLNQHGTKNKIPHVLIEIRNDLILRLSDQKKWSLLLAKALSKAV